MHLLGKSIKMELIRDDEKTECLSQVDDWDFAWQRTYMFDKGHTLPITIDDRIRQNNMTKRQRTNPLSG